MTTLLEFRDQIRRSILKDEVVANQKWSNEAINDYIGWALDTLCAHTALPATVSFVDGAAKTGGGTWDMAVDTVFPLPVDLYEPVELSGRVSYAISTTLTVLDPLYYSQKLTPVSDKGFYTWPSDSLNLAQAPGSGATVRIDYFAYYPTPTLDADVITAPRWAFPALAYLVGVHALSSFGTRSANIRQWSENPEKGNPEDNSLRAQQEWFLKMYERELSRVPRQDRANFFRDLT